MIKLTASIIAFYGVWFVGLSCFFYWRKMKPLLAFATSLAIVLVASEYYEVPIFIAGFLGVAYWFPYPSFAFILHHLFTIAIFTSLIYMNKLQISKGFVSLLALGIICNSLLLLPTPRFLWSLWLARFIGMIALFGAVYNGSSLVRS